MARHLIKGQAAMERGITERNEWPEYLVQREALEDEGLEYDIVTQRFLDDPRWQVTELVDEVHEDMILELDELAKSGKSASIVEIIMWVAKNLGNDRAIEADVPDAIAWTYYTFLKENIAGQAEFWKTVFPKLLPSSRELENQARYSDDGSKQIELAERILARMAENVAQ